MTCSISFVQYVVDQCSGAENISVRKMFGDYAIYCNGLIFGLICNDCLFIKPTEARKAVLRSVELRSPYNGAKPYFYIDDVDSCAYLLS